MTTDLHGGGSCVIFSTAEWDAPYWTNSQHTARAFAKRGYRVHFIETVGVRAPQLGSSRDLLRLWRRLWRGLHDLAAGARSVEHGIEVLSPLTLPFGQGRPWIAAINRSILNVILSRVRSGGMLPLVWTYHPFMLAAAKRLEGRFLIYHCVDDIGAVPGVDGAAFQEAEHALAVAADAIFVTTRALESKLGAQNPRTYYLSNVVDFEHFRRPEPAPALPADLAAIPSPRLGYHGVLSSFKVDFDLLGRLARAHPAWSIVLIGQERVGQKSRELSELQGLPNVHVLGYRPYADMPSYLHGFDVGLLPSRLNAYTASMFPMKYFEYLAAGVPIVATPLAFTADAIHLEVGADVEDFASAVDRQLSRGRLSEAESRTAVGDRTWDRRLERMFALLETIDG